MSRGHVRRRRGPGRHRRGAGPARPRGPPHASCSSTRSTASTRPSRTRCCRTSRTARSRSIGATTENPYFEVNSALLSRLRVWRLEPLTDEDVAPIVRRALDDEERGLAGALGPSGGVALADDAFDHLVDLVGRRRAAGAQRARGRRRARGGRGRPRRRWPRLPHPRPRRGRRPAAGPRLRPRRRRPLRHGVGVHQEPARQRPRRRPVLAGGDDRRRRGPAVHRPAPDHLARPRTSGTRIRGRSRSRSRRPRRSTTSGCRRRSTRSPRRRSTSRRRPSRTRSGARISRRWPTSMRLRLRCPCPTTCGARATGG